MAIETTLRYLEQTTEGGWRLAETRVSLDSVIHAFWEGLSPEAIVDQFPTLSLEKVYGAISTYLHNREEFDRYFAKQQARWEALRKQSHEQADPLLKRLRGMRSILLEEDHTD